MKKNHLELLKKNEDLIVSVSDLTGEMKKVNSKLDMKLNELGNKSFASVVKLPNYPEDIQSGKKKIPTPNLKNNPQTLNPQPEDMVENSKWVINKSKKTLYYLVSRNGQESWLNINQMASWKSQISSFHQKNPFSPHPDDYKKPNPSKKEKVIMKKIQKSNVSSLSGQELGFIAASLITDSPKPKEYVKSHFKLKNTNILRTCSYLTKRKTIKRIITLFGLGDKVQRISLIGDSILELYTVRDHKDDVVSRFRNNGWDPLNFDPMVFDGRSQKDVASCMVNRLAFLYLSTSSTSLRSCILKDLKPEIAERVVNKAAEINEKRNKANNSNSIPKKGTASTDGVEMIL